MRVENGPYGSLTPGQVVDRYRQREAIIAEREDELALTGFPEVIDGRLGRIAILQQGAFDLRNSIPEQEFQRANRPHRRFLRYMGEVAGAAMQSLRRSYSNPKTKPAFVMLVASDKNRNNKR